MSRALCVVLAAVGALPLLLGVLLRTELVRHRASAETEALIQQLLGVHASYAVRVELLPLELVLENVRVDSTDGGAPALTAKRMVVTPRLFSLLAGRLDAGDIEIEASKVRLVLHDGKLANLAYRLPESKGPPPKLERSPFASLSLTDAAVSIDVDGVHADVGPIDLDVFAEPGLAFETALRIGESRVVRQRESRTGPATDDDVLCELDARMRLSQDAVLVRRIGMIASADGDPKPGTFGTCKLGTPDAGRVELRVSEGRLELGKKFRPTLATAHVVARAPMLIANRFAKNPFRGWAAVAADVRWDPNADLPEIRGKVRGEGIEMGVYKFAQAFDGDVDIKGTEVKVKTLHATYGHANVTLEGLTLHPMAPGVPLRIARVDSRGLRFEDLMELNDVTRNTIVQWNLDRTLVTDFGGTLSPLKLDGEVHSDTTGFEIFDRAYHSPARRHIIGVKAATISTRFGVHGNALLFTGSRVTFGQSEFIANVSVGFDNTIDLSLAKGSRLRLSDASPLVDIPMEGMAEVDVAMKGKASSAELTGSLKVNDLVFDGFPIGNIESAKVRFKPLVLDFDEVHGTSGGSRFYVPTARLDFDSDASLLVDAQVKSDHLELRDFFTMWHFDQDPRFDKLIGRTAVDARVQYDMGGRRDKCGGGFLRVAGRMQVAGADLFEEHYDSGDARFDFRWVDPKASYLGMQLDVPSLTLKKGDGTILGNIKLGDGGVVRAHLVGTGVPLSQIDALGAAGKGLDGAVNAIGEVSGTLDAMDADIDARITTTRLGRATLPGSDLRVHLEPIARPLKQIGKTACGRPLTAPFDQAVYDQDRSDGLFHVSGQLFGGQVKLDDVRLTRQRSKTIRGDITAHGLDLGALAELSPAVAMSERRLEGRLSGKVSLDELPLDRAGGSTVALELTEFRLGRGGVRVELMQPARLAASHGRVDVGGVTLAATVPTGERALFDLGGYVAGLGSAPKVDVTLALRKTDLGIFSRLFPQAERVAGTLSGALHVSGGWPRLAQSGQFKLEHGELALRGAPVTLTDVDVAVGIDSDEIRIINANATVGGGSVDVRGSAPIRDFSVAEGHATITARNVSLPVTEGVRSAADADLELGWQASSGERRSLPKLTGDVTLTSFRYTRKVTMAADIDTLTKRGHRTHFESYDPLDDLLDLDVRIRSSRPLEINNDLVEAKVDIADPGLALSGTNQRFGLRGELDLEKGGHIRLRRNDFEITQGLIRFDDDERIAPRVDVTAVTDYHRYDDTVTTSSTSAPAPSAGNGSVDSAASATAGGRWRITLHAYGDPDTLRVDLSSEPALSQDDIFLLLTLGLTRAELDRAQSASAGGSVALEALGRLTGADEAVTENIPVIDEFKLGSAYSSRTGRTEPTVTIGKRLAQRIRAYVTSGLSDQREVRSNLEWRLSPRVSVEGSYDNVNDISSSTLGNLGADIRWRLEFE
ncbi:MAG TPA: translocation/assembly module TamB domain-containing protein [Polyangiaceae bacterium]|nr:translocation/assembly module TamB domain-containing protein [Polyangiaceae bacterium]